MGSRPRSCMGIRRTRRRPNPRRRFCKPQNNKLRITSASPSTVTEKLEALKNLIPVHIDRGEIKADQLFQETAEYIVLLRTQISVLQKLVDIYGSEDAGQAAQQS